MNIQNKEEDNKGSFYIEESGKTLAEMTYIIRKDRMMINHTEVDESLRGKNVGFSLVEQGVEYARERHLKIVPICKYAKKIIEQTERFHDILKSF